MKAIHVVPGISKEASGPSYSVVRLCESLIENGQDVTLAALDGATLPEPSNFLKTFPVGWGPRRLGRSPAMRQWLAEKAASGAVDVIHNHSLWMMPNVYAGQVAQRSNVPLVVSPRGTLSRWAMQSGSPLKRVFWPALQRPALRATECFHATADSEYEDIRRMGFRQPVAVVPNGIDIPELLPKAKRNYRTLLFLGRIHPIKGLDLLLPAWRAVQDRCPQWQLQIAGPDNRGYLGEMRSLAGELRVQRVEFSGPLVGARKWQAYRDADLFILPTYSENFGMAVAEALAQECPAIVTRGAPWQGLEREHCGWWVNNSLDELIKTLFEAMTASETVRMEMGARGRSWMRREFDWLSISESMMEVYQWLKGRGAKPDCVRFK